ncbi:hypothetical protein AB0M50_38060 [Nonomuraea fuscirosea]|uniref:hypothetical protein n=1 Tax=Nonomuraea fuscirosea TaxID=1291556 RepID=UPI00341E59DC
MGIEHDWTLLPAVVVRSAGFPWELVLSLAHPRAAGAAAAVVRLERRALGLLADAPGARTGGHQERDGRLPGGLRGRLRALRPLPAGTPGPDGWVAAWNEVTGLLEEARLTLAGLASSDAALARTAVAGLMGDERFLDALVCDEPALYRDLRRGAKGGRTRRQLAARLQRLAASCETTGCYGPIGYGTVEPGAAGGYTWKGHRELTRRVAYPAARVTEALQQRLLADPGLVAGLVPRRTTWTGEAHDGAAFAAHCDGRRTLAEIAEETGTGMEQASAALAVAVRRGLLTHDLCPPATVCDPLSWLRDRLAAKGLRPAPGRLAAVKGLRRALASGADVCECGLTAGPSPDGRGTRRPWGAPASGGRGATGGRGPIGGDAGCSANGPVSGVRGAAGSAGGRGVDAAGAVDSVDGAGADAGGEGAGARGVRGRGFVVPADVPVQRERVLIGGRPGGEPPSARRVEELSELLGQYPAASPDVKLAVQRRIETLTGLGRRDERPVVHEAAAGTLRVTAGGGLAADLRGRVPRVLDLLAEEAELTRTRTNRLVAERLGAGTFELAEVLRATGDLRIDHSDRLSRRIAALVRDEPAGVRSLDLAGLLDEPVPPAVPVLCSADVMVAAASLEAFEEGVTPLILDRLHDSVLLTPWATQFHEDGAACLAGRDAEIKRALSGCTVLNVISHRSDGAPPSELPGPVLELGGATADPARRRIGLDELYVHSDGRRAILYAKGTKEPLLLHNGEHDTALHTALALPRIRLPRLGDLPRVPRLTWDNVVISRRRWQVGRASFEALGLADDDRGLLVAAARLRQVHDLPAAFYARSGRDREPFYVDTRSPALLEGLARLAAAADRVTMTEVLPGPDECWLRDGDQRFAAELRCVYLRPAGDPGKRATARTTERATERAAGPDTRRTPPDTDPNSHSASNGHAGHARSTAFTGSPADTSTGSPAGVPSGSPGPPNGRASQAADGARPRSAHPYPWPWPGADG